ncbi:hypothetical protein [Shewanella profunda]|uniref:hypothetical protein n=1 Tax=Shewanella TaxID=22 RepID=UPI00200E3A29|nr:hypothetical protein [Shewanella profunda]MCL1088025.1 hypothetical protein [Shewanella profunda]
MDKINFCKRRAKQIKADYPDCAYMKRLDIAAKEMGFENFTKLQNKYSNKDGD